jgi:hypothetical protein
MKLGESKCLEEHSYRARWRNESLQVLWSSHSVVRHAIRWYQALSHGRKFFSRGRSQVLDVREHCVFLIVCFCSCSFITFVPLRSTILVTVGGILTCRPVYEVARWLPSSCICVFDGDRCSFRLLYASLALLLYVDVVDVLFDECRWVHGQADAAAVRGEDKGIIDQRQCCVPKVVGSESKSPEMLL